MGLNLNLCHMLGVPTEKQCPACGNIEETTFTCYDVDYPECNPEPGKWVLDQACSECKHEWTDTFCCRIVPEITPEHPLQKLANNVNHGNAAEILWRPYSWVFVPQPGGGYTAKILEFPGCFAEGDSILEAHGNLVQAATDWVKACLATGQDIPKPNTEY